MSFRLKLLATVGSLAFATGAHATTIFDLGGSLGATPTFAITSGGNTATFTSPVGNGFQVQDTTGLLTFSTALLDSNFFGTDNLTITFSQAVKNDILIPFAILDAFDVGPDLLTVTANTGQSALFAATPDNLALSEPEGLVDFSPTSAITSLTLSSPIAFAIGSAQIPEPMTVALFGIGAAGLVATRRRRAVAR